MVPHGPMAALLAAAVFGLPGPASSFVIPGGYGMLTGPRAAAPLSRAAPAHRRPQHLRGATALRSAFDGYESMLTLDTPAAWAAFLLWSVPLPATIGKPSQSFSARFGATRNLSSVVLAPRVAC